MHLAGGNASENASLASISTGLPEVLDYPLLGFEQLSSGSYPFAENRAPGGRTGVHPESVTPAATLLLGSRSE
jgi:hypothetical protein